jgi:molybdate transport system substrate-binding protein
MVVIQPICGVSSRREFIRPTTGSIPGMLALLIPAVMVQTTTLNVFAAASLKESLTTISRAYEKLHPGITIKLNFAGSQTLAAQINNGSPADVFASAAAKNLNDVAYDKSSYRVFALNRLEIAVRKGLRGLATVRDLANVPNLVVAAPAVPAGRYAQSFLTKAGKLYGIAWLRSVESHIVSREVDVKSVLAKVRLGEADAGIVYVSDVRSARGQVGEVPIPDALNEIAEYPVAIPSGSTNRDAAKHFIKSLLSADAQRRFVQDGFTSITTPVSSLTRVANGKTTKISLPLPAKFSKIAVRAVDERKQPQTYTGVLASIVAAAPAASRVTFVGADSYSQTFTSQDLHARRAVLIRHADGNYQLIVPGLKPSAWVDWLRRIEVR